MDPDVNLREQLELVNAIQEIQDKGGKVPTHMACRLAELVEALDGWLLLGGFKPARWVVGR